MAFDRTYFKIRGKVHKFMPRKWEFLTTDPIPTVLEPGYFDLAYKLHLGDIICVHSVDSIDPALRTEQDTVYIKVEAV